MNLCDLQIEMLQSREFYIDGSFSFEEIEAALELEQHGLVTSERDESRGYTVVYYTITHSGRHVLVRIENAAARHEFQ